MSIDSDPGDREHVIMSAEAASKVAASGARPRAANRLEGRLVEHHRRVDRGRVHGVDADHARRELAREALHQPDDAVLGRHVVADVGEAGEARGRAREHDRAAVGEVAGIAALQVCQTPVRLMSIMSCQVCSGMSADGLKETMPALALTMSSRPSSATPRVERLFQRVVVADVGLGGDDPAAERLDRLRPSRRDRRPWPAGTGPISTCAQMSTAMMSAPSSASRTAWLRPCPRAAPVTNATLPSNSSHRLPLAG